MPSQNSICSEPPSSIPFQLSIEKCLPEETVNNDEKVTIIVNDNVEESRSKEGNDENRFIRIEPIRNSAEEKSAAKRPNTLLVNKNESVYSERKHLKHLYRSNSSSLHKRTSKIVSPTSDIVNDKYKLSRELDRIYFISSNKDDENYDSIEVIDERRRKNLPKSEHSRLYKSNTFICEEYYSNPQEQEQQQEATEKNASKSRLLDENSSINDAEIHRC